MTDLNFYWRMGDYALEACSKHLARFPGVIAWCPLPEPYKEHADAD